MCLKKGDWKDGVITCEMLDTKLLSSSDSHPLRGAQNIATGHKVFCKQYSEKERIESLYFPEGK